MHLSIETNAPEVAAGIQGVFQDQIPFALALSTNRLANRVQEAQRQRQDEIFTLRRKRWADRAVKRNRGTDFATKDHPVAIVRYQAPGGREEILTKFETEDVKVPRGRSVAVPTANVPRTAAGIVKKNWRPSRLHLKKRGRSKVGERGTYLIDRGSGYGLILRRKGRKGDSTTEVLYWLVPQVDLPPDLEFYETAEETVDRHAESEFFAAFDRAIATARI